MQLFKITHTNGSELHVAAEDLQQIGVAYSGAIKVELISTKVIVLPTDEDRYIIKNFTPIDGLLSTDELLANLDKSAKDFAIKAANSGETQHLSAYEPEIYGYEQGVKSVIQHMVKLENELSKYQ